MAKKRIEIRFEVDTANAEEWERMLQRIHEVAGPLVQELTGAADHYVHVVRKRRTRAEMQAEMQAAIDNMGE